jgi:beta-glucosidase-like glycosyl hydrolase
VIAESRIDDAVRRILAVKLSMGLVSEDREAVVNRNERVLAKLREEQ